MAGLPKTQYITYPISMGDLRAKILHLRLFIT